MLPSTLHHVDNDIHAFPTMMVRHDLVYQLKYMHICIHDACLSYSSNSNYKEERMFQKEVIAMKIVLGELKTIMTELEIM